MGKRLISIGKTAKLLGVSIDTLRRWDKKRKFPAIRTSSGHRYYRIQDIDLFMHGGNDLVDVARRWVSNTHGFELKPAMYCQTSDVFKARLEQFQTKLSRIVSIDTVSLVTAISGEIGNNSFDHNLGSWPDIMGIFFAYSMSKKQVVLADRGQGVLTTLKRVQPQLTNDSEALTVAFTKRYSGRGRYPEIRGNGLKFVREVVTSHPFTLYFQSGNASLELRQGTVAIQPNKTTRSIHGCFVILEFTGAL